MPAAGPLVLCLKDLALACFELEGVNRKAGNRNRAKSIVQCRHPGPALSVPRIIYAHAIHAVPRNSSSKLPPAITFP